MYDAESGSVQQILHVTQETLLSTSWSLQRRFTPMKRHALKLHVVWLRHHWHVQGCSSLLRL